MRIFQLLLSTAGSLSEKVLTGKRKKIIEQRYRTKKRFKFAPSIISNYKRITTSLKYKIGIINMLIKKKMITTAHRLSY